MHMASYISSSKGTTITFKADRSVAVHIRLPDELGELALRHLLADRAENGLQLLAADLTYHIKYVCVISVT